MTVSWMANLATHYQKTRHEFPHDQLIIIFDIDGTILDMRHMIQSRLLDFDVEHQTNFFHNLTLMDINVHENNIEPLLNDLKVPVADKPRRPYKAVPTVDP